MREYALHPVSLREYVAQILQNAVYEKGEELPVIVAEAPDLPGCFTQGASYEEARENLVDAIEVWILSAVRTGSLLPAVNGCCLAIMSEQGDAADAKAHTVAPT